MPDSTCSVPGCDRLPQCGYGTVCQKHYQQRRKVGVAYSLPKVATILLRAEIVGECWIWRGARRHEYGECWLDGKKYYVHRLMYALTIGPIPDGFNIRHTCDTQLCIRPDHLRLGTQAQNMADVAERGRWRNQSAAGFGNDPNAWRTRKKRAG